MLGDIVATNGIACFDRIRVPSCARSSIYASRSYTLGPVVDRIGSGDAFAAGILHGFQKEFDCQSSLDFGLAAACLKHSIAGDFNLCSEEGVLHSMRDRGFGIKR
jgi:2-dehydro-3-deoxygluconokinase